MRRGSLSPQEPSQRGVDDLFALQAATNNKLREVIKEVVYLNGRVWEMWKRMEGEK